MSRNRQDSHEYCSKTVFLLLFGPAVDLRLPAPWSRAEPGRCGWTWMAASPPLEALNLGVSPPGSLLSRPLQGSSGACGNPPWAQNE